MDLRYLSFDVAQLHAKDSERANPDSVIRNTVLRDFALSMLHSFVVSMFRNTSICDYDHGKHSREAVRMLLPCSGGVSRVLDAGVARPVSLSCGPRTS